MNPITAPGIKPLTDFRLTPMPSLNMGPAGSTLPFSPAISPQRQDTFQFQPTPQFQPALPIVNQPGSPTDTTGQNPPNPQAQVFYSLGERYYQNNHFSHAIDAFSDCIQLNPGDFQAYNKRGVAKATIKDYAGAFADYSQAIALKPDFYKAYINRGNLWVYLGDLAHKRGNQQLANQSAQNALKDFSEAIRLSPMAGVAYENRAELYSTLGMHAEAKQDKGIAIQLQRAKSPRPMGFPFCPPRIALVLANDDYVGTDNDLNGGPTRDASRMAQKLRSEGFEVITGNNLTGSETKMKVAEFINKLQQNPNAVSLTYYSGHGGSINGNNYLIPVNYSGTTDPSFSNDAVSVDYLLKQLKATNTFFNMIFLDACRTPLPESSAAFKSGRPALKQWETEPGPGLSNTWVEYASRPKQPAMQDNNEGLYTKYLLQYMGRPDLSLKDVSMYTAYALENDPVAVRENQHSRTQTDLSRTEPIAEAFCFADKCAINRANRSNQGRRQGRPAFETGANPPSPYNSNGHNQVGLLPAIQASAIQTSSNQTPMSEPSWPNQLPSTLPLLPTGPQPFTQPSPWVSTVV